MKIIVTGGVGFIGAHTVVELINNGFEVIIVDDLSNSELAVIESIKHITGKKPHLEIFNLIDHKKSDTFFKEHQDVLGVIHFAAFKKVGQSVKNPLMYYRNNLASLINVLEGMGKSNIPNIVFSSSCTIYGVPKKLPVSEESDFQQANNPYGNTKIISEAIIKDFVQINNINAINLRYFNPVGAHQSSKIGELPFGAEPSIVPIINQVAIGVKDQFNIFGDDYDTPDGTAIRDYIHVVDVAKAHVCALRRMLDHKMDNQIENFNLGTGVGYSVLEVVKSFEKISGIKLKYKILGRREGDVAKIWADPKRSNSILGWKAKLTLEDMLMSSWKWERAYRSSKSD